MFRHAMANRKPPSRSATDQRLPTLTLMFICHGLHLLGFGAVSLFLPMIRRDLDITYTLAGILSACSTLVYAFMQIPAGALVDRFGPRRVFMVGSYGHALTILAVGVAPNYLILAAVMVLNGFFRSLVFTPGLLLLTSWFPPQRRATALSGFIAGTFAFNAILMLAGPILVYWWGWRLVFVACSLAGFAAGLAFGHLATDSPLAESPVRVVWTRVLELFRHRFMWMVAGMQFIRMAIVFAFVFWLPTFLVDDMRFTLTEAGLTIAMLTLLGAPSGILGGYLSDRTGRPVLIICGSFVVLAAGLATLALAESLTIVIAAMACVFVFMQSYFGALFALPIDLLGPRVAGVASGFGNFFANLGGFTCGLLLGILRDRTESFAWGFGLLAALALAGFVLGLFLAHERATSLQP